MAYTKEGDITNESQREAALRAHEAGKDLTPEEIAARLEQAGEIVKQDAKRTIAATESNAQQLGADGSEMGQLQESGKKYEKSVEEVRLEDELEILRDEGRKQLNIALQGKDADEPVSRITLRAIDSLIAKSEERLKELTGKESYTQSLESSYNSEIDKRKQGTIEHGDTHEHEASFEKPAEEYHAPVQEPEAPRWENISPNDADTASGGQRLTARMERATMGEEAEVPQPEQREETQATPKRRFFATLNTDESNPLEEKAAEAAPAPQPKEQEGSSATAEEKSSAEQNVKPASSKEEAKQTAKPKFEDAKTFSELYDAIEESGGLQGSKKFYDPSELKEIIEEVQRGERGILYVTSAGGLRDAVERLINLEKSPAKPASSKEEAKQASDEYADGNEKYEQPPVQNAYRQHIVEEASFSDIPNSVPKAEQGAASKSEPEQPPKPKKEKRSFLSIFFNRSKKKASEQEKPAAEAADTKDAKKMEASPEKSAAEQKKTPEQILHDAQDAYRKAFAAYGEKSPKKKDKLTDEESKLKQELEAARDTAKTEYDNAIQAVMTGEYLRAKKRLEESGAEPSRIEHELNAEKAKLAVKYFGEQSKMQTELTRTLLASEKIPAIKKGAVRKALNWWMSIPKAERWAISAGIATGVAVTLGTGGAGMGIGAYFASKFMRSALSSTLVGYTNKGLTKAFESHDVRAIKKELTKEISSKNIVEHFDQIRDSYGKASQAQLSKTKLKNVTRFAASLAVGGGTALMTGMIEKGMFSGAADSIGGGKSGAMENPANAPKAEIGEVPPPKPGVDADSLAKGTGSGRSFEDQILKDKNLEYKDSTMPRVQGHESAFEELATVKKGEGVWHPVRRQFEEMLHKDPHALEQYGLKAEDVQDAAKVRAALNKATQSTLVREGYIDPTDGTEAHMMAPGAKIILNPDGTIKTDADIAWKPSSAVDHVQDTAKGSSSIQATDAPYKAPSAEDHISTVEARGMTEPPATIDELKIGKTVEFKDGSTVEFGADEDGVLHWRYADTYKFDKGIEKPQFLAQDYEDKISDIAAKRRLFRTGRVLRSAVEKELLERSTELNKLAQIHEDLVNADKITEASVVMGGMRERIRAFETDFGKEAIDYGKLSKIHGLEDLAPKTPVTAGNTLDSVPSGGRHMEAPEDLFRGSQHSDGVMHESVAPKISTEKLPSSYADVHAEPIQGGYKVDVPEGSFRFTVNASGKLQGIDIENLTLGDDVRPDLLADDHRQALLDLIRDKGRSIDSINMYEGDVTIGARLLRAKANIYEGLLKSGKTQEAALFAQDIRNDVHGIEMRYGDKILDYGKFPQSLKDLLKK
jgi:hypothetical protein